VQQIVMCLLCIKRSKKAKSLVGDVILNHICCLNVVINLKVCKSCKTVKANVNACTVRPSSHNSIVATDDSCEVKHDGCNVMTATEVDTGVHSHVTDSLVHS